MSFLNSEPFLKGKKVQTGEVGGYVSIFEAQKDPNIYIKEINEENIQKVIDEYNFLKKNFGDFFPKNQLVIGGENQDNARAYILMEKVNSESITKENKDIFFKYLFEFLEKIINFYIKNSSFNEKHNEIMGEIIDFYPRNLIFGKTKGDKHPRLYCIDNYPSLYISKKQLIEILSEVDKYFHISETQYRPKLLNLIFKVQQL